MEAAVVHLVALVHQVAFSRSWACKTSGLVFRVQFKELSSASASSLARCTYIAGLVLDKNRVYVHPPFHSRIHQQVATCFSPMHLMPLRFGNEVCLMHLMPKLERH